MGMSGDYKSAIENGATFVKLDQKSLVKELLNFYFSFLFINFKIIKKSCFFKEIQPAVGE